MVHNAKDAEFSCFPSATGRGSTKPAPSAVLCSEDCVLCAETLKIWGVFCFVFFLTFQLCLANEGLNFFFLRQGSCAEVMKQEANQHRHREQMSFQTHRSGLGGYWVCKEGITGPCLAHGCPGMVTAVLLWHLKRKGLG